MDYQEGWEGTRGWGKWSGCEACRGIPYLEVPIVDVFEYKGWSPGYRVLYDIKQCDYVRSIPQVLQNLYLSLYLFAFDWLNKIKHYYNEYFQAPTGLKRWPQNVQLYVPRGSS